MQLVIEILICAAYEEYIINTRINMSVENVHSLPICN